MTPTLGRERTSETRRETIELRVPGVPSAFVLFVERAGRIYVIPSPRRARWAIVAQASGRARIRRERGAAVPFDVGAPVDASVTELVRTAFVEKYGPGVWDRYFADAGPPIELRPASSGTGRLYSEAVKATFDAVSDHYHEGVLGKPFERYLRERTTAMLLDRFRGIDPLLEIGPGTGIETLPILSAGHRVVGVDISDRMVEILRENAARAGLSERLRVVRGQLGRLSDALSDLPSGYFGGAYSTFGAFNLEERLDRVPAALAHWIRPGGRLAFVALNRPGLAAFAWEWMVGNPRGGFARISDPVPAGAIRYPLDLHVAGASSLARTFAPYFRPLGRSAVSILAPPFESERALRFLEGEGGPHMRRLDAHLSRWPGASLASEWVLYDFLRTDRTGPPLTDQGYPRPAGG